MTTTSLPTRSTSRFGLTSAVVVAATIAMVIALFFLQTDGSDAPVAHPAPASPTAYQGSADALEHRLEPAAGVLHGSPDTIERSLAARAAAAEPGAHSFSSADAAERWSHR